MSNLPIFDVVGSAMQAQSVRMSTIASNLANADTVAASAEAAYRPLEPIFKAHQHADDPSLTGVRVKAIGHRDAPPIMRYEPGHPLADENGYIYAPDVDPVAQMVDSYQADVEVLNTAKDLALSTLSMGR